MELMVLNRGWRLVLCQLAGVVEQREATWNIPWFPYEEALLTIPRFYYRIRKKHPLLCKVLGGDCVITILHNLSHKLDRK